MNTITAWSLAIVGALALAPTSEAAQKKQAHDKKGTQAVAVHRAPQAAVKAHPQNAHQRAVNPGRTYVRTQTKNPGTYTRAVNHQRAVQYTANQRRVYNNNQPSVNRTVVHNYQSRNYQTNRYYNTSYYRPPVTVYRDWDRGGIHEWNHHRYHWYNNAWVIFDVPTVATYTTYSSGSVAADVQAALRREGYNPGPIDGVIGGQTRDAIADYQHDHGLAPTGGINDPLLRSLGV